MTNLENLGRGGYCSRCNTIKPIEHFTRYLTNAEAKSRGYAANYRVKVETSTCKDCRPKARPPSKLRAAELRQRVSSGDLDPITAGYIHKKRLARATISRKLGRAKQAYRTWQEQLMVLLLGEWEKKLVDGKLRNVKRKQGRNDPPSLTQHIIQVDNWVRHQAKKPGATETPLYKFMVAYLEKVRHERERIKNHQLFNPGPVVATRWEELVDKALWMELRLAWADLTPEDRRGLVRVTPDLVLYNPEE
jgi:hypothetical protein